MGRGWNIVPSEIAQIAQRSLGKPDAYMPNRPSAQVVLHFYVRAVCSVYSNLRQGRGRATLRHKQ